jgi:hypothetical protein
METPYGSMSGHVYGNLPKVMEWIKMFQKKFITSMITILSIIYY